ncbi:DUF2254 domain-containing protein [Myxococcus landrumensis]|uniref:DUF2254 domain-containing protein n=1 Tax=Myxococcus landrumensis TaxID=2813577 RepID=A0ABX7MY74_9BACT|nr:DUF2254 domain-containing protein [Myxococcus landrumus]QSQ11139.1 DUF2254 domain-containing protein [Myxococcus landrumus]
MEGRTRRPHEGQSLRWWVRHQLWIPPLVGVLVGGCLGVLLVQPSLPVVGKLLTGAAWQATANEARNTLSTVLGIVLTSLSIILSLSMLVVQNAAGQYSPRLLRMYLHSAGVRVVIPVFVGTSVFCLVASHAFGLVSEVERAPRPALALAMVLLVLCEGALIYSVFQTFQLMRVENLVRRVREDTLGTARTLEGFRVHDLPRPLPPRPRAATAHPLRSRHNGFIAAVDAQAMLDVATARRLVVQVERSIGEPVTRGEALGWFDTETDSRPEASDEALVLRAIRLDRWRDDDRDLALGVRQLVDVAIKALSPGINDPYTAVEAVDQLTFLLCELSRMRLGPRVLADDAGTPRVFLRGPTLRDLLTLATDQILRYGAEEPAVVLRLLRLTAAVGQRMPEAEDRQAAREQLRAFLAVSEQTQPGASWHVLLRHHTEALEQALDGGPWPPLPAIGF